MRSECEQLDGCGESAKRSRRAEKLHSCAGVAFIRIAILKKARNSVD